VKTLRAYLLRSDRTHAGRWRTAVGLLLAGGFFVAGSPSTLADNSSVGRIVPDLATLARQALISLPPPPAWGKNHDSTVWTVDEIKTEFGKITDTPPRVNSIRGKLVRADHRWLVDFKGWFRSVQKPLKIHFEDQLFDCDNYANCFVAFADLLALQAGESRGSFCIGWATVHYRNRFAGIRAGGAHAVVMVGTTQGLFVLEPQDGTMVALRDFPNRHTIEEVYF
jgi:hypothetical protein